MSGLRSVNLLSNEYMTMMHPPALLTYPLCFVNVTNHW